MPEFVAILGYTFLIHTEPFVTPKMLSPAYQRCLRNRRQRGFHHPFVHEGNQLIGYTLHREKVQIGAAGFDAEEEKIQHM